MKYFQTIIYQVLSCGLRATEYKLNHNNLKVNIFIFFLLILFATILFSCKSSFPAGGTLVECNGQLIKPLINPEIRPEFPGKEQAMYEFFGKNLTPPKEALNKRIKGKIRVAFIVTKEGEICDIRITSKPKEYYDSEVIRVMKLMPKWNAAAHEGKIVDSYYLLDIKLK
jgi:TonB family protein